jgi:hypothetical protein
MSKGTKDSLDKSVAKRINEKFYHMCTQYKSTQSASVHTNDSGTHFERIRYHLYQRFLPLTYSNVRWIFHIKPILFTNDRKFILIYQR